jgi:hypothetical protein
VGEGAEEEEGGLDKAGVNTEKCSEARGLEGAGESEVEADEKAGEEAGETEGM